MFQVISMLQLVFSVLLLKQSVAVNWECRGLQKKISGLQTNITRITEQKHNYEQFLGHCKVSI